jgi:cytochrome P450
VVHDDLLAPDVRDDPHAYFHALRAEDPVHWNANHRAWILTSYGDVLTGFRDSRLSAERLNPQLPPVVANNLTRWMVFLDEPDHTRLRRLIGTAFSTLSVRSLRPRVESIVDSLLDSIDGTVDWVAAVAEPLPAIVIAELLGVPPSDRARFLSWSADIAHVVFGAVYRPDRYERAAAGVAEFDAYFRQMIDGDGGRGMVRSLASALDGDESLTTDEVIATCTMLLFAGHETTTSLLTTGLHALLLWPDELARLRADSSLAPDAVEELMRYTGPTGMMVRKARDDVEMRDKTLRAGDRVFLGVAAANHDPDRFADPDRLDITRADKSHLGFGFGIHHCLGAPLARLEAEVAFTRLLDRFHDIRLSEQPTWSSSVMGRSLPRLLVQFRG